MEAKSNTSLLSPDASLNDMEQKIKEILKNNQINDPVSEVIFQDSGLKGENMASVTQCVTVKFENPKKKPLNLFMKMRTQNPSHNEMVEEGKLFEKETMFFMKYLPEARTFCKTWGQEKLLDIYPKCYYGDKEIVIFENLVLDKGYILINKEEQQDFECANLALTTLAKHHAISYAFMNEIGGAGEFFKRFPNLDFEAFKQNTLRAMLEPAIENGLLACIGILEKCNLEGKDEALTLFRAHKGIPYSILLEVLEEDASDKCLRLLGHGDFWNNNMMFLRDNATNEVKGHIAVDFQLTRYSSPSIDIGYYMYTSVQDHVRQSRLEELLKTYLNVLKTTASSLGYPLDLTYEEFYADYQKKFRFGFWFGIIGAAGAGLAVLKEMDPRNIDISQWGVVFGKLIEKWMENNPEICAENAQAIVKIAKEYKTLSGL